MKILVDPGHGFDVKGKESPDASNGLVNSPLYFREYAWARKCAHGVVDVLQAEGYDAELLVPEEWDVSLDTRVARVNAWCRKLGAANVILVSIHVNAAGSERKWLDARGWCIYTSRGQTKADDLATCIYNNAVTELAKVGYTKSFKNGSKQKPIRTNWTDGDADQEAGYAMIKKTMCPAVLSENLFQDNKEDVAFLKTDKGLGAIIQLHVQGIEDYLKNEKR